MILLVDDQYLSQFLRGERSIDEGTEIYSTGLWYVRLCQAALRADGRTGALSRPFAGLDPVLAEQAKRALLELPEDIGLLSLRTLAPLIGQLHNRHQLNALSSEVLAAAVYLQASVALSAPSPKLETALGVEGIEVTSSN